MPESHRPGLTLGEDTLTTWLNPLGYVLLIVSYLLLASLLYYFTVQNLDSPWTSVRLAPTFALSQGYPLYSMSTEPPWVMIGYGPAYPLMYSPALLASTPTGAVLIATVVAHGFILIPITLLLKLAVSDTSISWSQAALIVVMLYPLLLLIPSVRWVTTLVAADAPTLGLILLSALSLLNLGAGPACRSTPLLCLGGAFLGLAISSKANIAPAGLAFVLWLAWFHSIRTALVFALAACLTLSAVYGAALLLINPRAILLNFEVLGNFPWSAEYFPLGVPEFGASQKQRILALKLLEISKETGVVVLAIILALSVPMRQIGRRILPPSQAARASMLLLLLALTLVLPAAASVAKWGGAPNSWALFTLPLTLSALFALLHLMRRHPRGTPPQVLLLFTVSALLVVYMGANTKGKYLS